MYGMMPHLNGLSPPPPLKGFAEVVIIEGPCGLRCDHPPNPKSSTRNSDGVWAGGPNRLDPLPAPGGSTCHEVRQRSALRRGSCGRQDGAGWVTGRAAPRLAHG